MTSALLISLSTNAGSADKRSRPSDAIQHTVASQNATSRSRSFWYRLLDYTEKRAENRAKKKMTSSLCDRIGEISERYSRAATRPLITSRCSGELAAKDREISRLRSKKNELYNAYGNELKTMKDQIRRLKEMAKILIEARDCSSDKCRADKSMIYNRKMKGYEKVYGGHN